MKVFDHIDPAEIDRREVHLHVLALIAILVLALGLALMMYPTVFAIPITLSWPTFQTVFFSFCILSVLLLGYLLDRHLLISKLRVRIAARERAIKIIKYQASKDFLASLPANETFTDRLTMEFRRASSAEQPLSLLAVEVKVQPEDCSATETAGVYADAGRAILSRTRGEDSLFVLDPGLFVILLPRISTNTAESMKTGFEEGLRDAAGLVPRFGFEVRLINYPDQASSVHEMMETIPRNMRTR